MTKSLILMATLVGTLAACQKNSDSTDLSYALKENDCSTEEHHFSSHDDYCAGLKNDSLNHYCASELRAQDFKSNNCSGDFDN